MHSVNRAVRTGTAVESVLEEVFEAVWSRGLELPIQVRDQLCVSIRYGTMRAIFQLILENVCCEMTETSVGDPRLFGADPHPDLDPTLDPTLFFSVLKDAKNYFFSYNLPAGSLSLVLKI